MIVVFDKVHVLFRFNIILKHQGMSSYILTYLLTYLLTYSMEQSPS